MIRNSVLLNFSSSLLITDYLLKKLQRTEFFSKCNGFCIEAKQALVGQVLTLDLLAGYINNKYGSSKCLPDINMCPDGAITLETARTYLGFSNADLI